MAKPQMWGCGTTKSSNVDCRAMLVNYQETLLRQLKYSRPVLLCQWKLIGQKLVLDLHTEYVL